MLFVATGFVATGWAAGSELASLLLSLDTDVVQRAGAMVIQKKGWVLLRKGARGLFVEAQKQCGCLAW